MTDNHEDMPLMMFGAGALFGLSTTMTNLWLHWGLMAFSLFTGAIIWYATRKRKHSLPTPVKLQVHKQ